MTRRDVFERLTSPGGRPDGPETLRSMFAGWTWLNSLRHVRFYKTNQGFDKRNLEYIYI